MHPASDDERKTPRKKRRRVREEGSGRTQVGEQHNTSLMGRFSDDVSSLIISFLAGIFPRKRNLFEIFNNLGFVSKWGRGSCIGYAQRALGDFELNFNDVRFAMWLCRTKVKLGSLDYKLKDFDDMSIVLFVLNSCNVSGLRKLRLDIYTNTVNETLRLEDFSRCIAIQEGLPDNLIRDNTDVVTREQFQTSLIEMIGHLPSLKVLDLSIGRKFLHAPLLARVSDQLEELILDTDYEYDRDSRCQWKANEKPVEDAISNMKHLKYLRLTPYQNEQKVDGFSIRSQTLQTLAIGRPMSHFNFVKECICPMLKKLSISIRLDRLPETFLSNFTHSVVELHLFLEIFDYEADLERELATLSSLIEGMDGLKKLRIRCCVDDQFGETAIDLRIRSKSLEEINVEHSTFDFTIIECNCPMLRQFKGNYTLAYGPLLTNGVCPVDPVVDQFLFSTRRKISVSVTDQTFRGMTVPDSCVVELRRTA